jgi:large subunit ribosomal protein L32
VAVVPKRKTTRAKRDMRRANHDRVKPPNAIPCPNCGDMMLSHRVCPSCGHYKGREIEAGTQDEAQA